MHVKNRVSPTAAGVLLLCWSLGAGGVVLGRNSAGMAWVGQNLDVRIPVQFSQGDESQGACFQADVQYGETAVDPSRVRVQLLDAAPTQAGAWRQVRVEASLPVDEPVVTVVLRHGCQQKQSRRYTLLSELPTSLVQPESTPRVVTALPPPRAATVAFAASFDRSAAPAPGVAKVKPTAPKQGRAPGALRQPAKVQAAAARQQGARLQLDALELILDREPGLRGSDLLANLPLENDPRRAQAAAMWRALQQSPEQLLAQQQQEAALSAGLRALQAANAQNSKGLEVLAATVDAQARVEPYANPLVGLLAAVLALLLGASVWVWRRSRSVLVPRWTDALDAQDSLLAELVEAKAHVRQSAAASASQRAAAPAPAPAAAPDRDGVDLELDIDFGATSAAKPAMRAAPITPESRALHHQDFSVSIASDPSALDTEELVDVRQQAEFFTTLGQYDRAIEILTTRVAQCGESSPLVCLDLMRIFHHLGRQSDFDFMRNEFNHWFAATVPEFARFGQVGRPLEAFPQVLQGIVDRWPNPGVLEYIESCLYRHTGESEAILDLDAYLDLLFLHSVAKRLVRQSKDEHQPSELLRVPARQPTTTTAGAPASATTPTHRPGAQWRGAWKRQSVTLHDPEEDVETRGAPLGSMKVPPLAVVPKTVGKPSKVPANDTNTTDFNFLGLR